MVVVGAVLAAIDSMAAANFAFREYGRRILRFSTPAPVLAKAILGFLSSPPPVVFVGSQLYEKPIVVSGLVAGAALLRFARQFLVFVTRDSRS